MQAKVYYQSGFSLIELLIVIIIVAILAAFAAPSYKALVMGNKVRGVTEDFLSALSSARAEAVTRKRSISLCLSADGATCSAAGNWNVGYIMYVDEKDETSDETSPESVIGHWTSIPRDANLTLTRDGAAVTFIRYTSLGTLARVDNSPAIFVLKVDGCAGTDNQRQISVALSGIPSITREACPE